MEQAIEEHLNGERSGEAHLTRIQAALKEVEFFSPPGSGHSSKFSETLEAGLAGHPVQHFLQRAPAVAH